MASPHYDGKLGCPSPSVALLCSLTILIPLFCSSVFSFSTIQNQYISDSSAYPQTSSKLLIYVPRLVLSVIAFHPISSNLVQKHTNICQQAEGNTWLFSSPHAALKNLLHMPHVDNLVLGLHLAGHTPSFLYPFSLSGILYYLILFSCRIGHRRGDNTVLFHSCCFHRPHFQRDWYSPSPSAQQELGSFKSFKYLRT